MENKLFCPECGNKLDGHVKFCPECGFNLSDDDAPNLTQMQVQIQSQVRQQRQQKTDEMADLIMLKQKEAEDCENSSKKSYKSAMICAGIALAAYIILYDCGWGTAILKWLLIIACVIGVLTGLITGSHYKEKYNKLMAMTAQEYQVELQKRAQNKQMATDIATGFAKGFTEAYLREKFRKY